MQVERQVIAQALAWPTAGPQHLADQLAQQGIRLAATTIYRILRRASLNSATLRLTVLERHVAATQGLLTERTRRELVAAKGGPRQIEARVPG